MKKFYYLLICLMLPMVFISCGDDEDDDLMDGDIIGTWICTENHGSHKDEMSMTFDKDGNFTSTKNCPGDVYVEKGSYVYNKPNLILHSTWNSDDGNEEYTDKYIIEIKGNKLTYFYNDSGEVIRQTLTKK